MAFLTSSNAAITSEISDNVLLAAFGFRFGSGYEIWNTPELTYTLNIGDTNPDGEPVGTWTSELTQAIETAHADLEAISLLRFTEIPDQSNGTDGADVDYWAYDVPGDNTAGFSYGVGGDGVFIDMADVYQENSFTADGLTYGGLNYRTVIHEILHNLGMAHPHDGGAVLPGVTQWSDTGDHALNQNLYTVLSYNSVGQVDATGQETTGYPFTFGTVDQSFGVLGTLDIAVIQALYGANWDHATDDDIYELPDTNAAGTHYKAIWDAGGTDEFRYTGTADTTIDLRAATLDIADGMLAGGIVSTAQGIYGGLNIAHNTVIENATTGSGNDLLVGNAVANVLTGGNGQDVLSGGAGNDTLSGGDGADELNGGDGFDMVDLSTSSAGVEIDFVVAIGKGGAAQGDTYTEIEGVYGSEFDDFLYGSKATNLVYGGAGDDTIHLGMGNDSIWGGAGNDMLQGGTGNDFIDGGDGDDWVRGGKDADELVGGRGFDWLDYGASLGRVFVDLENNTLSGGDAEGDVISQFEAVSGTAYSDHLIGSAVANTLAGGNGGDTLEGGAGDDVMWGGIGRDTFIFGSGSDTLNGGADIDTVIYNQLSSDFDVVDLSQDAWRVTHLPSGDVDKLIGIEFLMFEDITLG